jgi:hypothetical protein
VYGHGTRQAFNFTLGQFTTVFQAEVYTVRECADENIKRGYCERDIYILNCMYVYSLIAREWMNQYAPNSAAQS